MAENKRRAKLSRSASVAGGLKSWPVQKRSSFQFASGNAKLGKGYSGPRG